MNARIERLVGLATLQGLPITGYRRFGVPPGGAFDRESFLLANALAGNEPSALTIELSNAAITLVFSRSSRLAITGAPVEASNSSFDVAPGQVIEIPAPSVGLRIYVAIRGGWIPDGIESPLARVGRKLVAGEVLRYAEAAPIAQTNRLAIAPGSLDPLTIRVMERPQPLIEIGELPQLVVSNDSDRTGIRLDGLEPMPTPELTSEPACVGAIQLTPSGQLIIIGPDGPTIGGYPKIAVVCEADLDKLAQLRPGQSIHFTKVDLRTARQLGEERRKRLGRTITQIQILRPR